ncbi:beta-phosphoglucomutase [Pleurocapsa sp. PCC 7327]|uniref:beta-phosphoglucomutase n=1 Tax=Pleurocapsa sp. PCC 7327 TaxID=118163 RepID=UPI00029FBAED|nr:beta-phosphoglucomutase [Pleurocapsa sp. PCC 7327]AFY77338.1 beta-phosphoglucomutase [Pleurocapsa sp. PCC 7327]
MSASAPSHHFIYTDWNLIETQFDPEQINHKGTVFTIGNGYLGTRGSFEEGYPRALSATLINGVYDDVPVVYTELANCPDWLPLTVSIDGENFRLDRGEVLSYQRQLDLQRGILSRKVRWRSPKGKTLDLYFERFASLADQNVLALRCQVTPLDFNGSIAVSASLNGYPENQGYNHWEELDRGDGDGTIWLHVRTRSSHIELGMAAKLLLSGTEGTFQVTSVPGYPTVETTLAVAAGQTATLDKIVTVFTSREAQTPAHVAQEKLAQLSSYAQLQSAHIEAWEKVWQHSDLLIEGDTKAQLAVRYNLFQLLISAPRHDNRVSIPAKTLSGFGYRGHIFWDTEIFILPFFIYTQPNVARNLLTYRYHTLNGARRKASYYGYKGAMFAWESAETGDEVTPRWALPNQPYAEDIRIWCRDREIHISSDIAYAIWSYWQATNDDEWMRDCGAEIILDGAVFWNSRIEWNPKQQRYEIREVIGADEYHEHVSNNAFTNRMVQWHLEKAIAVYQWLCDRFPERAAELEAKLGLTAKLRDRWEDMAANLWIPYDPTTGLIEQYEGFFNLEDIDLAHYEPRTRSMQEILGIEGANKRQVLKQPDVLMLLYLMRQSEEFPYNKEILQKNWDYYAPRTDITYGSSLGPAIHGILASDLGQSDEAYKLFLQAAMVDLEDVRGNAADGIHAASAGGVWQAVVFGFGGFKLTQEGPVATPHLPSHWQRLKFKIHWRSTWYDFDLRAEASEQKAEGKIQGVIFDLDGVLTDTAEFHYRAWQRLADEEGIPFDRQANEALRGISRRESLMRIVGDRNYTEAQLEEMMERKNRYYVESIQDITPDNLLPGARELLDELRAAGIKIAIGSASKNARMVIEHLGIADKVDAIADGYSVQLSKPAPDLFLHAAELLGLEPFQCVVVEDAESGIEAGLAAGMLTVGLGPAERVGKAHVVLPSLEGISWEDLQSQLFGTAAGSRY